MQLHDNFNAFNGKINPPIHPRTHSYVLDYMKIQRTFLSFLLSILSLYLFSCGGAPTETTETEEPADEIATTEPEPAESEPEPEPARAGTYS